jgi:hypothetical protein
VGKFDNLNDSQIPDILRRLARLETASPVNNTAIGRGGIEVYDGGVINVSNGGLNVVGSGTFTGTLYANGTIAFTGTLTQSGPSTFTGDTKLNGPTHINGATDITGNTTVTGDMTSTGTFTNNGPTNLNGATKTTGTLSVEGVTTLKNDLNVTTGKVVAGGVTIDPSYFSGSVKFSNGTYVAATPNGAQMVKSGGGGALTVSATQADMGMGTSSVITTATAATVQAGGSTVLVNSYGATVTGRLDVSSTTVLRGNVFQATALSSNTGAANLYIDPSGFIYKSSSAARFKVDAKEMYLPDSLLAVPVKDWLDAGEVERGEATRRTPGAIAEEVAAAGGEAFVTYDEAGDVQGLAYDRYALARTAVLARQVEELRAEIAELRAAA